MLIIRGLSDDANSVVRDRGPMPAVWNQKRPAVQRMFEARFLWCLGVNESDGSPKHPLYLPKTAQVEAWMETPG